MEIFIDGKDVSSDVTVGKCIHEDNVSGRADALSVSFNDETDDKTDWRSWGLEKGTEILVKSDGFSSGTMYVSSIKQADGRLDVRALSTKSSAKDQFSKSYSDVSLFEILKEGADALEMTLDTYDIKDYSYKRISRIKQDWLGFMQGRCLLEGYGLKIFDKKIVVFCEKEFETSDAVMTLQEEDFESPPSFCTDDNLVRAIRNIYQGDQLYDTTVESGILCGQLIETEVECSSIGESQRFSKNIMRNINKNEFVMSGKITGTSLSAGVCINLDGSFFGYSEGSNFVTKVATDLVSGTQGICVRKPIDGDY